MIARSMAHLVDEWLQLEQAIGFRPLLAGKTVFEMRTNAAAVAASAAKPEPESLKIGGVPVPVLSIGSAPTSVMNRR